LSQTATLPQRFLWAGFRRGHRRSPPYPDRNGKGVKAEQSLALQPGNDPMPNATLAKDMTS
jgi:hypothetical protein